MKKSDLFQAACEVASRLRQAGHTVYFAGGWVRDYLLKKSSQDIDIATSATPDEVIALFPRTTGLEGKSFGVVRVLMGAYTFEVATFRVDMEYKNGRRPEGVRFAKAEEDAERRDFTVNGLFYDPLTDEVIDWVGGKKDLEKGLIRAIGDPRLRFEEDKLRILRCLRFAVVLGFEIEKNTWKNLRDLSREIRAVSIERVRDELNKIWTSKNPARGLDLLDESLLLSLILPEISALHGVEQPPQFHPEGDVFIHTRLMLSQLENADLVLALSVLLHDVGKPPTQRTDETGRIRFNGHEHVGAHITQRILERFRYSNNEINAVVECVKNHMSFKDAPHMRLSKLKRFLARDHFETEMDLHWLDCKSSHGDLSIHQFLRERQEEIGKEEIKPPPLLNGKEVIHLGVPFGPSVGAYLEKVRVAQLDGVISTHDEAIAFLKDLLAKE